MTKFHHTADIHLGKTYRTSAGTNLRYEDFFHTLTSIAIDAISSQARFVLISGDLFHTGQILPKTFAKTIEILQPLKDAGIPCIAVEGNHDWIHRRDSISWMEALSQMGYIKLLRPTRTENGGYRFDPFDEETGSGGRIEIDGINIYGLGYIGAQAGAHVPRICEAVTTNNNILLFHVGIWTYSPVEIGNIKPEEALPLAECFDYVALGHGHKAYTVSTPDGRPYAFNPGSPERVNFGEEGYDKGYWAVKVEDGKYTPEFRTTAPRPMQSVTVSVDGADTAEHAMETLKTELADKLQNAGEKPLIQLKVTGRVQFHPFELGRERVRRLLDEVADPLHCEIKNHLSLITGSGIGEKEHRSLADIERDVLRELIGMNSEWKGKEDELVSVALTIRDHVLKGDVEGEELLGFLSNYHEDTKDTKKPTEENNPFKAVIN
ncbi:DNA repair exonuclease SbcCD, D subunit, putative [Geotalea daltonii FRC-32]|uniref:DNA repair exonuclease SbcCD, D subunit, putative n=1 Tax=Geotalea daltonii (strain DSM 22248 / JCM 15807 / FRC-32) TaxID=316067 RepID=B9M471_GEODF|nr:exonuclease SbcCD subunit D [Geotalea daltonii]ACM21526.1 DNA repair exonuclease SbcCD, D subunit, putative [Geotalea daltonii FRC-32]